MDITKIEFDGRSIPKNEYCRSKLQDYFLKLLGKENATYEELALISEIAKILFK